MTHAAEREDEWLVSLFPVGFKGHAVDVGAHDGESTSNTLLLEKLGWTVLCIEPQPKLVDVARGRRARVESCACGSMAKATADFWINNASDGSYSSLFPDFDLAAPSVTAGWTTIHVPVRTLTELLTTHGFETLDALSIDTEGSEFDVLLGLDLTRWKPLAIVCESWKPVSEVTAYLSRFGYSLFERRGVNNLYLRA